MNSTPDSSPAQEPAWTRKALIAYIKETTGQANVISIPRVFIEFTGGDHTSALVLSQVVYWSDKTKDPDGWFFKSAKEWYEELLISNYQISRAVKKLAPVGVEVEVRKTGKAPTRHFRLDWEKFLDSFFKFLQNRNSRNLKNQEIEETSKSIYTDYHTTTSSLSPEEENKGKDIPQGTPEESSQEVKPVPMGKYGIQRLFEKIEDARSCGEEVYDPPEVGKIGARFKQLAKNESLEQLDLALDYMVTKAAGLMSSEPKAWCYLDTALDRVKAGAVPQFYASEVDRADNAPLEFTETEVDDSVLRELALDSLRETYATTGRLLPVDRAMMDSYSIEHEELAREFIKLSKEQDGMEEQNEEDYNNLQPKEESDG